MEEISNKIETSNMLLFSIIIPAFNCEGYIERVVNSIAEAADDRNDYEIIIVDDGSTDSTGDKCRKLQEKCKNIRIIIQENQGSALARLNGFKEARGKYSLTIDSDDLIAKDYFTEIEKLLKEKKEYDFYFLNNFRNRKNSNDFKVERLRRENYCLGSKSEAAKLIILNGEAAVWNKIFKSSILKKVIHDIESSEINPGIIYGDDQMINILYLRDDMVKKIYVSDLAVYYHYQDSETSICRTPNYKRLLDDEIELFFIFEKTLNNKAFSDMNYSSKSKIIMETVKGIAAVFIKLRLKQVIDKDYRLEELRNIRLISKNYKAQSIKQRIYKLYAVLMWR
ncbi:MAG: glycosyltransferase family 2 protein [Lachnospiraceae bacterium]|nr:glycosyltransferase family 2 protein [Lachnospiraceae bacterium]